MEKVIPAHTSSASDPHRFRLGHRFPCAFSSFGPKVKMPLALGNEKKLSGPWKVYYSIQTLWRSEPSKGSLLKPQKAFFKQPPTWTGTIRGYLVSFLNIHSSRLRHRFPCAFWANINLVELVPMRRNENPEHTHGCVLIEAPITHTFGPKEKMPLALGNEKKLSGPWKVYYSIQTLWRSEPSKGNLLKPKKYFFKTTSNLNRNHPRLPRQFLNSWNEIKIVLVNSP